MTWISWSFSLKRRMKMGEQKGRKLFRFLTGYYGILQTLHLIFLGRAGIILQQSGRVPFPASPPPGGWSSAVLPFFIGMASADFLAAVLGIYFAYSFKLRQISHYTLRRNIYTKATFNSCYHIRNYCYARRRSNQL